MRLIKNVDEISRNPFFSAFNKFNIDNTWIAKMMRKMKYPRTENTLDFKPLLGNEYK